MKEKLATKLSKEVRVRLAGKSAASTIAQAGSPPENSGLHNQLESNDVNDDSWLREQVVLRRAAEDRARQRNASIDVLRSSVSVESFDQFTEALEDPSPSVRHEAVRLLYELDPDRAASFFNVALREGSPAERREIGAALAGSGLVDEAIKDLIGDSSENSYSAFSFLFLVAKAGEVQPLVQVIKDHSSIELRLTVIKLLVSSGDPGVVSAFRGLMASNLPAEIRAALNDAVNQINKRESKSAPSAA